MPTFVLGFLILTALNSFGLIPEAVSEFAGDASRWALLIAISAVGMKSSLKRIFDVGGQAITLIFAETVFIGVMILFGISVLGGGAD